MNYLLCMTPVPLQAASLREILTRLGPAFVKIGQVCSLTLLATCMAARHTLGKLVMIRPWMCVQPGCLFEAGCCAAELHTGAGEATGPDPSVPDCRGHGGHAAGSRHAALRHLLIPVGGASGGCVPRPGAARCRLPRPASPVPGALSLCSSLAAHVIALVPEPGGESAG
jgi:hypothetical protein